MAAPRHFLAERASATAADVQVFVERFIQLLLLGIEFRHLLLFILVRRRPRSKLLGAGLQMADRRATRHGGRGAREWFGIDGCVARDQDAADGCCDEKH